MADKDPLQSNSV